jgi:CHAT domain-containing protein
MSTVPRENCPDQELLQELAAGIGSPELAQRTMQHVARCRTCAAALRRYIREFSPEQSPEDLAILNQLKSSRPEWQKKLVREQLGGKKGFRWLKLAPAGVAFAAAVLGAFAGPTLLLNFKVMQANKQVASAFAQRRTTEMRLSSVDYSPYNPFPITLGPEGGRGLDEVPPSLHEASGAANKNLQSSHADPRWLQIQGRALLWESTPSSLEKAEKDFEKAKSGGLATPSLEIDLAASYFERDSRADRPNLQRTLNLLSEVLNKPGLNNDDRASALYDLAITYEKMHAWDMAVSTWEKYLAVDSTSAWAEQARTHLKEGKTKSPGSAGVKSTDPKAFLQQLGDSRMQRQVEDYQDIAISMWLPDALEKNDGNSIKAVHALADLLRQQHSDAWLGDLLSSLEARDLAAVKALAIALQTNGQGDHTQALAQAQKAAQIFAQNKSPAGEFRARIEEVNALRRALNGSDCLARASPLWDRISRTGYHWLKARLSLEKAECDNLIGAFADSDSNLQASRALARQFDFPLLELRNIGISAGNKRLRGNCSEGWRESVDGLAVYWQKLPSSQDRLYQFYSVMFQCALETGTLYAGEAFLRHALEMREKSPDIKKNRTIEGILHLHLANVLLSRKADQEAKQERERAAALIDFKKLPPQFELTYKLEPAEFQLQHGDAKLALATLQPLRQALAENPDSFFSLRFNQALGNTFFSLRQLKEAAEAYQNAIHTSEKALDSIQDWSERLQWIHATEESYRGLVRVLIEQKDPKEALRRWELYRSRPLIQGRFSGGTLDYSIPQAAQLTSSAPRLVYAGFSDGLNIWTLHNNEVSSQWVQIERQDFENTVREFLEKCAVENSSLKEVQELGAKLYSVMVQPVIDSLAPSGTVIIELDPQTYSLPMEALRTPEGRYWGEKYSPIYSPGIWMEGSLRLPIRFDGHEPMLFLDASHAPGAGYLPGLEGQRAAVGRLFPRTHIVDSTRTNWAQARPLLATSTVFHYMGHGRPDGSGTSFDYAEQPLRAADFSPGLLRNSEMVVLAACSGAAGRENGLADTNNMVRAFLNAGVPAVIASHWNVDSTSTSQLMISFYQHLSKGETAAQAMYNARIEVLQARAHPYFWAGFTLTGRAS